jgi:hypothetical protein
MLYTLDDTIDSLKRIIGDAFGEITHPGDDQLLASDCFDVGEVENFRQSNVPTKWQQLAPSVIDYNYGSLPFLSPSAYRFFLPAYLIRALDTFRDATNNVIEFVIYALTAPDDPILLKHFLTQQSLLNSTQRKAIHQFLKTIEDHYPPLSNDAATAATYWR